MKRWLNNQKGQALVMVLCVLAIGGMTIAASLRYSTTALKGNSIIHENLDGIYAAGAGIEHTIWSLGNGVTPLTQLPEQINRMTVNISTNSSGNFTLYLGELRDFSSKPGVITVNGTITPAGGNRYMYTITVTRGDEPGPETMHLQEIGARLPIGYTYDDSASRSDGKPLGSSNPVQALDSVGAWMLQWFWISNDRPTLRDQEGENIFTLSFYITGTASLEGEYTWTMADATGYGLYSEVTGGRYQITATARRPYDNRTIARITADVIMQDDGYTHIASWRINN